MNSKGLYTSAIGILIILLISANIFVFLGADKSSSNGSNVADEIMDVKTTWHKAAFLAEQAVEKAYHDNTGIACDQNPSAFDFSIVSNTFNGLIKCDASYVKPNLTLTCYNDNVNYVNTFKVSKGARLGSGGCEVIDKYANDAQVYP